MKIIGTKENFMNSALKLEGYFDGDLVDGSNIFEFHLQRIEPVPIRT